MRNETGEQDWLTGLIGNMPVGTWLMAFKRGSVLKYFPFPLARSHLLGRRVAGLGFVCFW